MQEPRGPPTPDSGAPRAGGSPKHTHLLRHALKVQLGTLQRAHFSVASTPRSVKPSPRDPAAWSPRLAPIVGATAAPHRERSGLHREVLGAGQALQTGLQLAPEGSGVGRAAGERSVASAWPVEGTGEQSAALWHCLSEQCLVPHVGGKAAIERCMSNACACFQESSHCDAFLDRIGSREAFHGGDVAWLLLSMLHCSSKDFGLSTGRRGLPGTRQVLAELLHAKATADLAASRSGAAPQPLAAFALQHLGRQHGLEQGQQQWLQLAAAVRQHCSDPAVAAFGVACGLMAPEEAPAAQAGALLWAPGNDLSQASHCRPEDGTWKSLCQPVSSEVLLMSSSITSRRQAIGGNVWGFGKGRLP